MGRRGFGTAAREATTTPGGCIHESVSIGRPRVVGDGAGALLGRGQATAAEPKLEKIDLFEAGKGGYALYHIPGVVVTARGTVLAWCEARKKGGDWDAIDILLRRSTDDGKTWSEPRKVADGAGAEEKEPRRRWS